jgi:hypothetical protein
MKTAHEQIHLRAGVGSYLLIRNASGATAAIVAQLKIFSCPELSARRLGYAAMLCLIKPLGSFSAEICENSAIVLQLFNPARLMSGP